MDVELRKKLFTTAKQWVLDAGQNIKANMHGHMTVDTKSDPNDLVTSLDQETERFFAEKISGNFPGHKLFGEEGYGDDISSLNGTVWIIDPIDGTMNFVHQKINFAISVGIYYEGIGEIGIIYDVMNDNLYTAQKDKGAFKNGVKLQNLTKNLNVKKSIIGMNHFWLCENNVADYRKSQALVKEVRGVRNYGSAALEFAYVAEGVLDGYLSLRLSPWDVAAGMVIVNEVDGLTTDIKGDPLNLLEKNSILVCNKRIHASIVEHFNK